MSPWTIGWLLWAAWFAAEEGLALARGGSGTTLSAHLWRWFGIAGPGNPAAPRYPTGWVRARRAALLCALAWLCVHLLTGGAF
jgi:hypothetical protein